MNVCGKEIELEGGVFRQWLPYKWSTENPDPAEKVLENLDMYPSIPSDRFKNGDHYVKFDEDIHRNLTIRYGNELKTWLDKKSVLPNWQVDPNDEKAVERLKSRITSKAAKIRSDWWRRAIKEQLRRMNNG